MSLSAPDELIVEADGGSRGNPGPAGYGAVVRAADGRLLAERGSFIGHATNNVAEYRGLIAGMEAAAQINPQARLRVRLDSKLVVEQMSGNWKIKHPDMRELALRAREIFPVGHVTYEWVPRAENTAADELANAAMDGGAGTKIARDYGSDPEKEFVSTSAPVTLVLVCHPGAAPTSLTELGAGSWDDIAAPSAIVATTETTSTAREVAARIALPTNARSLDGSWVEPATVPEGLAAALKNHGDATVVVVASAAAIRAAVAVGLSMPEQASQHLEVQPGSATILRYESPGTATLVAFGLR
ncbi:MAG TPA: reverse transcriptase-like protein [Actinomycetales bacterium]|nr:reverse transcriptase-like protein [Actinomycetales bacterium]